MVTCEQHSGDFLENVGGLLDKGVLWTREWRFVDMRAEICGQESGDLWTREQRLVDKGVETCEHGSGDLQKR